ncbi:MAG: hypothetical protein ACYSSP_04325 [Planctomycetota bacterium]
MVKLKNRIIAKKGILESGHCSNFHLFLGQNTAGKKLHGITAAREPVIGWNFDRQIMKGPKPYITPEKSLAQKEPIQRLLKI